MLLTRVILLFPQTLMLNQNKRIGFKYSLVGLSRNLKTRIYRSKTQVFETSCDQWPVKNSRLAYDRRH